jgi:hypothetical protein
MERYRGLKRWRKRMGEGRLRRRRRRRKVGSLSIS